MVPFLRTRSALGVCAWTRAARPLRARAAPPRGVPLLSISSHLLSARGSYRALLSMGRVLFLNEHAPQHLPHHRLGKLLPELDPGGSFEGSQALFAEGADLPFRG